MRRLIILALCLFFAPSAQVVNSTNAITIEDLLDHPFAALDDGPAVDIESPCTCYNWIWTVSARQEIARRAHLVLEYSKIRTEPEPENGRVRADMGSLLLSVDF